uniref:C2H2-type domain-containing protein n=1 Tax=Anopheles atroparvus TaxID=41427 RepID=A0AAG5CVL2_ANOAO
MAYKQPTQFDGDWIQTMNTSCPPSGGRNVAKERWQSKVQKLATGNSAIACGFCNKSFKFNSTLRQHEKIHYGIKQHECEVCHRRFLHKGTLKCHLRLHTGETPYKCPHCPKAFRGQTALNCHVFRHTREGVKCPQCPMIFATSSIVKQHLKQVHTEERLHICNMCGMTYKHLKSLRIHLRNHQKRVCPDCGSVFESVYSMQKHRKRHIAESLPFKCGFCNRAFEKESELAGHEKLRGRPFQCDICCHSFNKQIYLVNHNRRVHWKAMGLERLKIAEPKNGWNRKGVPKPKNSSRLAATPVDNELVPPGITEEEGGDIRQLYLTVEETQEETPQTIVEQPVKHSAVVQYLDNLIVEGEELTELILIEEKDLRDLELSVSDHLPVAAHHDKNPLETENDSNKRVQQNTKKRPKRLMNDENEDILADRGDQHDGNMELACSFCGLLCSGKVALRHHKCEAQRATKSNKGPLICELCGNWYASATTLAIHRTNQHHRQRFQCDQCDRMFGFRCYLEKHISTHHQQQRIACKLCNKSFKYVQDLRVHIRQHDDLKPFKCDKCPSAFRFPSALRCHKILHQEELPFECDLCGKKFRFNNSLRVHKRLHVGVKQFKCDICEREFSTKAPMLRHMKVHNSDKKLSCVVCGAVFYKKVDLAIHESKEHPKHDLLGKETTIYKCDHCGKEFIKKSNLKAHSYIHEEVYRFPCQLCSQSFKQHAGLRAHLINGHKQTKKA